MLRQFDLWVRAFGLGRGFRLPSEMRGKINTAWAGGSRGANRNWQFQGGEKELIRTRGEALVRSMRGWQSSAQFAAEHQVGKNDSHTQRNYEYDRIHSLKIAQKRQLQQLCYEKVTKER